MARGDKKWTFPFSAANKACSSSFHVEHLVPVAVNVPQMAATTEKLRLQRSFDAMNVDDADATFGEDVVDVDGNVVEWPASAAGETDIILNPELYRGLGRVRLHAVTGAGADVDQVAQVVTPTLVEVTH